MACSKDPYSSKRRAHESVKSMGTTIRVYFCKEHHAYHVTKDRGGNPAKNSRSWRGRRSRGERRAKMDR